VFGKTVLRRVFGRGIDKGIGGWRNLLDEALHKTYSSPSIIEMIK
jgi:hypothetical protein